MDDLIQIEMLTCDLNLLSFLINRKLVHLKNDVIEKSRCSVLPRRSVLPWSPLSFSIRDSLSASHGEAGEQMLWFLLKLQWPLLTSVEGTVFQFIWMNLRRPHGSRAFRKYEGCPESNENFSFLSSHSHVILTSNIPFESLEHHEQNAIKTTIVALLYKKIQTFLTCEFERGLQIIFRI